MFHFINFTHFLMSDPTDIHTQKGPYGNDNSGTTNKPLLIATCPGKNGFGTDVIIKIGEIYYATVKYFYRQGTDIWVRDAKTTAKVAHIEHYSKPV